MINHTRLRELNVQPERVRQLITQIESQRTDISKIFPKKKRQYYKQKSIKNIHDNVIIYTDKHSFHLNSGVRYLESLRRAGGSLAWQDHNVGV
jgi:hypothetical protein